MEGYDDHTLWDVFVPDVSRIEVENSSIIIGMALVGQTTYEYMAWEIGHLTQLVDQLQKKLEDTDKKNHESKEKDMSELWGSLITQFEHEKSELNQT